ncbi:hypothetical protein P5673_031492 [Acropora cervicornis]|uniref:C-terminal of Roc (COR) domain-containing protein n=1 Tax=Acropora cervicornis TaxID=6130 RepID=A0AAD9PSU1_ACRCE|nr:hypothetical protein P5673_031492 [Acropora cervicornis]
MECSELQRLRKCIVDVIKELPHANEYIPIKWLKFEKALEVVLDEGQKKDHFGARQMDRLRKFVTVLDFLHDQRIVIHFDDNVELNKLVVLDPQWLIDVFKTVM